MSPPFRLRDGGIDLFVRLTPKSAADAVDGIESTSDGRIAGNPAQLASRLDNHRKQTGG
jgi:hypothetical protein